MGDLQQIRDRQNHVTNESLESTRRIKEMALEAEEAGIKTLDNLNSQQDQLDNVERGLHQIGANLTDAEKSLADMEKPMWRFIFCECCGACSKKSGYNMKSPDQPESTIVQKQPAGKREKREATSEPSSSAGAIQITRLTNDAREDEMEENLNLTSSLLGNMRNMAIDMGSTIEKQNIQLDRINLMAEKDTIRVTEADKRTKALLKN